MNFLTRKQETNHHEGYQQQLHASPLEKEKKKETSSGQRAAELKMFWWNKAWKSSRKWKELLDRNITELAHRISHHQMQVIVGWTTIASSAKENSGSTKSNTDGDFKIGGKQTV